MKPITLRNLPPEVAQRIRQQAKTHKTSLNRAVITLLEESIRPPAQQNTPTLYHDLDHLAGSWTADEAAAFDEALARQRRIDPELWK